MVTIPYPSAHDTQDMSHDLVSCDDVSHDLVSCDDVSCRGLVHELRFAIVVPYNIGHMTRDVYFVYGGLRSLPSSCL